MIGGERVIEVGVVKGGVATRRCDLRKEMNGRR